MKHRTLGKAALASDRRNWRKSETGSKGRRNNKHDRKVKKNLLLSCHKCKLHLRVLGFSSAQLLSPTKLNKPVVASPKHSGPLLPETDLHQLPSRHIRNCHDHAKLQSPVMLSKGMSQNTTVPGEDCPIPTLLFGQCQISALRPGQSPKRETRLRHLTLA